MIVAKDVTVKLGRFTALKNLSCTIPCGCIYGLVGSNGAGKSTFLRLISDIYRPQEGTVEIDGEPLFDNPKAKENLFLVPDELFFLPQSSMDQMARFYANLYPSFDKDRYTQLTQLFGLNPRANLNTFSKGMRRQAATILALAIKPKYLFFDETFDGLDPVMRNLVKDVIREDVAQRKSTAIIASHSLRELEDVCDQLALLHRGGIVFESDVKNIQTKLFKVQIAFAYSFDCEAFSRYDVVSYRQSGSVAEMIVRGEKEEVINELKQMEPTVLDVLPLNLEEVFIYEMEALGYAFKDLL
ncbi:MAG: ABC transporter ATP-binding protein [Clostridia bacterium]|nr:ABC transporter ATP-binding protein [Clostridia bacterium]